MLGIFVPQNFPSHISQNMARKISKLLKVAQELARQAVLKKNVPRGLCRMNVAVLLLSTVVGNFLMSLYLELGEESPTTPA